MNKTFFIRVVLFLVFIIICVYIQIEYHAYGVALMGRGKPEHVLSTGTYTTNKQYIDDRTEVGEDRQKKEVRSHLNIVLILTYASSGSTFLGSILQAYKETFYVFEPLRSLYEKFNGKHQNVALDYLNLTIRHYGTARKTAVSMDEIDNWLKCKLDFISSASLRYGLNKHFRKHNDTFRNCDKSYISYSCLANAVQSCQNSPLLALKTIRLNMETVGNLLPFYPNMKIIHLVRDPRGILNLRILTGAEGADDYKNAAQRHCKSFEKDLEQSREIKKTNSDKLMILRFEDLADRPLNTARELFEFVGINFVKDVRDFLKKHINETIDGGSFITQRNNISKEAERWRSEIDPNMAQYIYKECINSNKLLGYLPLSTIQTLRNNDIPSKKSSVERSLSE